MKKKKADKEKKNAKIAVKLGDTTYCCRHFSFDEVNKIKSKARVILNQSKDGDVLGEGEKSFMVDLLKFHQKAEAKLKDLKDISVGVHPSHPDTRCFMVVRNDGTKEDFSVSKCIDAIKGKVKEA